nr:hypothetical protein [Tanacetum cinerariifolium]
MRSCSSTHVETSITTQNQVRIIPGLAGIVQAAKLLKQTDIQDSGEECVMSKKNILRKLLKMWVMIRILSVVHGLARLIKSCTPSVLGDLIVTLQDISSTIPSTIHHKVINEGGGYGMDITVRSALILANVSVFSPKPSMHYLNITMRNMDKVFRKDIGSGSGSGVCENVNDEKDQYKLDGEALNLALEEKAREARAEHECWGNIGKNKCWTRNMRQLWGFYVLFARLNEEFGFALHRAWPIVVRHESEKTAWSIVVRHESEKTAWPIMVRHAYVKMAWPSVVRHESEKTAWPIMVRHAAEVEAAYALEVEAVRALDLVEALKVEAEAVRALDLVKVEAVRAVDLVERALDLVKVEVTCLVGLSLNILISTSVSGYLTSSNKTTSSSPKKPASLESSSSLDT